MGESFPQLSAKIWEIFKIKEKIVEKTVNKSNIVESLLINNVDRIKALKFSTRNVKYFQKNDFLFDKTIYYIYN